MVEPDGVLDNFRWETVALIGIWLVHAPNSDRLRVNLSVPLARHTQANYHQPLLTSHNIQEIIKSVKA